MTFDFYKLEIYIPESHFEDLRIALQEVDAGHIGKYDSCLSYSKVTSTWRPLDGCQPYHGTVGEISVEEELKVELTCKAERLEETIDKIISVRPYEEPVIQVLPLYMTGIKRTTNDDNWCQLRFDDNLNIVAERIHREMSQEEKAEYDRLTDGATQLKLDDFLG